MGTRPAHRSGATELNASTNTHQTTPTTHWTEADQTEHFVQFYEADTALLESVRGYVASGLAAGAAAIVIATRAHLDELERQWKSDGLDLEAARSSGQYTGLDADETLSRLLLDDWPQPKRFLDVIGSVVAEAASRFPRVIAFGEMVALLWKDGRQSAAIHLEELWNELQKKHPFALFCAYPLSECSEEAHTAPFRSVCAAHSRVIPAESYAALTDPRERLAAISQLQQKARALENEVRERRAAQRTLARRERELADFLDTSLEGLHKIGPDGTILWANKAELDMLGYPPEQYIGRSITEFHADPEVIAEILRRLLRGEVLYDQPARMRCKDGSLKHVLIHSNARWDDDKFVYTRCFTRDVTERVRLEEELQRRLTQLTEMDRRKDEFLAMLGHELRNPLAAIRSVAELLRRTGQADPNYPQRCEMLGRQVQQMGRLVDDLLDASRITQGKITLHQEPLEFMAVMARAIETNRSVINARGHHLSVSMPEQPIRIRGDLARLVQVFSNLLSNAAKYTPPGGQIVVVGKALEGYVDLSVRDNGVGITPELLPRVFDLFSQANQTIDRSEGGLGIGLALVRRIVELHQGRVEAFSAGAGMGSEFVVRLPLFDETSMESEAPNETVSIRPKKILVVDDNQDAAESLAALLRLDGHEVATAFSGPEALTAVRLLKPEVVLLDIGLPGMNGYEVAQRLREVGSPARLIALTGYGQPEDRERARQAGFHEHLVKPVDSTGLAGVLV
jgi:PAS domain S-box-containing protein